MDTEKKEIAIPEVNGSIDALDIIEKRDLLFRRIMDVAIKSTSANDWIDQKGKPWLQASGAEKVARRFAITVSETTVEREDLDDENGRYYVYTYNGTFSFAHNPAEYIEAIGTCSSRDEMFSHGGKKKVQDIDITNIKKSAYTNMMGNGITRLLGIRNLAWNDLAKYGITKKGKTSVQYDKGAFKAAASKKSQVSEQNSKLPYWTSDWNERSYLHAKVGNHFSEEFLTNLGFKAGKIEGLFHRVHDDLIETALQDEYVAAEEVVRAEKGGQA